MKRPSALNLALLLIISISLTVLTIFLTEPQSELRVSYPESLGVLNKIVVDCKECVQTYFCNITLIPVKYSNLIIIYV